MKLVTPFSHEMKIAAARDWGCNCGPCALAFACQVDLDRVRTAIPGFEGKWYTSPSMMRQGITALGRAYNVEPIYREGGLKYWIEAMCGPTPGKPAIVRVQWTGPWTAPGANPRWSYVHTHWIVAWNERDRGENWPMIYDNNGIAADAEYWLREVQPRLAANARLRDGGWYPTDVWRLR